MKLTEAAATLLRKTPPYVMGRDAFVPVRLGLLMDLRDALGCYPPTTHRYNRVGPDSLRCRRCGKERAG